MNNFQIFSFPKIIFTCICCCHAKNIFFLKLLKLLKLYRHLQVIFLDFSSLRRRYILYPKFTILENLSRNLNKFTCNISDTQNFPYFCSLNLELGTRVYFISLFFFFSRHTYPIRNSFRPAVHSPLQFHSFIFIPLLRLTPVHVETQYRSCTSRNSIGNRVYSRVYSSLFDPGE